MRLGLVVAVVLACLTACQSAPPPRTAAPDARPAAVPGADAPVATASSVTVLDDGDGPELCLGGVDQSLPPQCGGPELLGWDWADHVGSFEEAQGVRWGEFRLTGTFDGTSFAPTEVVPAPGSQEDPMPGEPPPLPCPEPAGGWRIVDASRAGDTDQQRALSAADRLPDLGAVWLDNSQNPAWEDPDAPVGALDDPARTILVVTAAVDPEAAERTLRERWGGMLCVARAAHPREELLAIQQAILDLPGFLSSHPAIDRLDLQVQYDDGSYQRWADAEYGPGVVVVTSALVPV